jgi:DNA modification methylase
MNALERLQAIEDIRNLKARYFRLMDTKQWEQFATLFTPDMQVISPNGKVWLSGGDAFASSIRHSLEHSVSVHQGFTAEIDIIDAENAKAIWSMQDVIEWEHGHPREGWKSLLGRGHYYDTYRRTDGSWRIATLCLIRLRLETK